MTSSILLSVFLLAGAPPAADSSDVIAGDYVEVRSNHVYTCGCLFSGELVTGGTEAILAWNVRSGDRAGTPLESFKAVAVTVGTESLSAGDARRKTVLYLDDASSESQGEAGLAFLRDEYSDVLGDIVGIRRAPIHFEREAGRTTVDIPEVARLVVRESRLEEDAHLGSVRWLDPFVPLENSRLGTVLHEEYRADEFSRRWWRETPGIRGYMGDFVLTSGPRGR